MKRSGRSISKSALTHHEKSVQPMVFPPGRLLQKLDGMTDKGKRDAAVSVRVH